jgi:predicted transport protein
MAVYLTKNGKLAFIEEVDFKLEKDIQKICEDDIHQLFGLEIVKSQFTFQNFRIDTLAFNPKSKSFVVIEYKKDRNFSVIDQGYAYLSLLLNNKADFVLEYNENKKKSLKRDDIDWTQTRVIFVSPFFTQYQIQSINFKDLPIELWEIKKYANETISFEQIQPLGAIESIKTISKGSKAIESVSREVKVYTEDDHLAESSDEIKELYEKFKASITTIGKDVKVKPTKYYLGFLSKTNFVDIHVQKKAIKIWLNLRQGELDDPRGLTRDVLNIGHWGNGDYELQVSNDADAEYIISLAKQSYKKNSV